MIKSKSPTCPTSQTVCLSQRQRSFGKSKLVVKAADYNTIASISEAENRIAQLEKKHKWRRQRRLKKLHDTYDENCRLYLSINSQKSIYALYRNKIDSSSCKIKPIGFKSRRYDTFKSPKQKQEQQVANKTEQYRLNVRQILADHNLNQKTIQKPSEKLRKYLTLNTCPKLVEQKLNDRVIQSRKVNKLLPRQKQYEINRNMETKIINQTQPLKINHPQFIFEDS